MTIHANDTAWRIIRDLQGKHDDAQHAVTGDYTAGGLHQEAINPDQGYPNRDGTLAFYAIGHDCVRGFKITVEAIDTDEAFRLIDAHEEEAQG